MGRNSTLVDWPTETDRVWRARTIWTSCRAIRTGKFERLRFRDWYHRHWLVHGDDICTSEHDCLRLWHWYHPRTDRHWVFCRECELNVHKLHEDRESDQTPWLHLH